jgi:hypothetical protein
MFPPGKKCKSAYKGETCTPRCIAALFPIARIWNQPRSPPTNEWVKKMWYSYTVECSSTIKKNDIMSFVGKWMELEFIMLQEISQTEKRQMSHILYHIWSP